MTQKTVVLRPMPSPSVTNGDNRQRRILHEHPQAGSDVGQKLSHGFIERRFYCRRFLARIEPPERTRQAGGASAALQADVRALVLDDFGSCSFQPLACERDSR